MEEQELEHLMRFVVQYIFENDTGTIDSEFCQPEIAAGRCTCQAGCVNVGQCTACLLALFAKKMENERGLGA